ncbi:MAG: hypothetical protein ACRDG2_06945 [Actinomycetota bacterium]
MDEWVRVVGVVAAVGFVGIAAFQAAIAAGAPLGRAAWGGTHVRLPQRLRVASAGAVAFWIVAALVVLARAGFDASPVPFSASRWATWILVVLLAIGAVMNAASRSPWERFLWAPIALVLGVLCLALALEG